MLKPRHLPKFLHRTPAERRYILRATFLLYVVRLSLSVLSFKTILRCIEKLRFNPNRPAEIRMSEIEQFVSAIKLISPYVPKATCLTQALAVQIFLVRRSCNARLDIGVTKDANRTLKAHAWIEHRGQILVGEKGSESFVKLITFGGEQM